MSDPRSAPNQPNLIVHADWGSHSAKRWMAKAELVGTTYQVKPPERVGDLANYLQRMKSMTVSGGSILLGFDFPIGLPYAYAQQAEIENFLDWLPQLGHGKWREFYRVAETTDQISIYRPFYPYRPGGTTRQQLLEKLGFQSIDVLRRECEKSPPLMRPAAPLFWTLGPQQVGKAALNGWEKLIIPGLKDRTHDIVIWPFSGKMPELIQPGRIIITETYPALYLHQLQLVNLNRRFSKRRQIDRVEAAKRLIQFAKVNSIEIHPKLKSQLQGGFGSGDNGDDLFDAVVGIFGMLQFFIRKVHLPEPSNTIQTQIEGWILGLPPDQVIV